MLSPPESGSATGRTEGQRPRTTTEEFREEVRSFLREHLPTGWRGLGALDEADVGPFVESWRATLRDAGLLAVAWPKAYGGRGLDEDAQLALVQEMVAVGVPDGSPQDRFSIKMLGNTLLRWGTEEQRRTFLPRIVDGTDRWCQGFSEPDAGSDLASLSCRADPVDGGWRVTGQKLWTSLALHANWIFLLARTDQTASKHRGISFLLCPLDQPGVTVRPIRALGGREDFCEVFFSAAVVKDEWVVGGQGEGWKVANTLLGFERGEAAATFPVRFRAEFDRLVDLARLRGVTERPVLRDRLARAYADVEVMRFLGLRMLARSGEQLSGPESSLIKLYWSEYHQRVTELAVDVLGAEATVPTGRWPSSMIRTDDPGAPPDSASWVGAFYNARAGTIYAGTSEIQHTLLAEGLLGLPRDPR